MSSHNVAKPKVSVVGIVGLPAQYGGFETLGENLIKSPELDYYIYCSSKAYSMKPLQYYGARLHYLPIKANGYHSVFYDMISLIHTAIKKPDVVLILGVSGCIFLPIYRRISKSKVITNIDGLEWKRDKWNIIAKKFLKICEHIAVRYSDVIISDNEAIEEYVSKEYSIVSKVIAYGGDHAVVSSLVNTDGGYALGLCRIEPENNVEMILEAFSKSNVTLKFIGNWKSNRYGADLASFYSNYRNIEIIDPIYDLNELFELRNMCSFYVHGHSAGGTNPSLVEMMHFGKTVIAYDCPYNRKTTQNKSTYFSTENQLFNILSSPIKYNGSDMKNIASKRYTWEIVRKQYLYEIMNCLS